MQDDSGFESLQQVVIVSGGPVDSGVALTRRGGLASRLLFRILPDLMRGLACHDIIRPQNLKTARDRMVKPNMLPQ